MIDQKGIVAVIVGVIVIALILAFFGIDPTPLLDKIKLF